MQTIACCVDNFKQDDLINAIQTGDQQKQIDNFNDHTTQSSQSLSLSSSSPSSSSSSQVTFTYNLNNYKLLQQNYARCLCNKLNQKQFDCLHCTQNYPINVRRSKDGEEDYINYLKNNQNSKDVKLLITSFNKHQQQKQQQQHQMNEINNDIILLKPSPIPVSSSLLSLLALTKPSNTFIPPPNRSMIGQSHLIRNNSNK